jgi:hypothetical protein
MKQYMTMRKMMSQLRKKGMKGMARYLNNMAR